MLRREFKGYNLSALGADAMAGLTVTAVALPLAIAFGVSCGADAAAGLITAIIAGLIIGFLSGASYQISGPTGAMSAVLVGIVLQFGKQGIFIVSFLAGILLLLAALLVDRANDTAWIPCSHAVRRYTFCYHTTCANNAASPDCHSGQYDNSCPYPATVFYGNR